MVSGDPDYDKWNTGRFTKDLGT